ncbi:MAG: NAD-dependent epimerase/dehydratase family protein, partial [Candidatus Eremiobacteraeota bacterium]|nr:NAD-dependent epimerase/dehydratase family protein [Candidatus Eremiobacteraeota bacterium]
VEGKRFGEASVMAHIRVADLNARIVRLFNAYGPRMAPQDGRVAPTFITQALAGEPLTIRGDGTQTRSFCFVDDIVAGVMRAADSDAAQGVVINLGNSAEISILDFAAAVSEAAGVELRITHLPGLDDDPVRRRPDVGRASALLGWQPEVALRDGLRRTVAAYRAEMVAKI